MRTLQLGNDWPGEHVGGLNRYFVELLAHLPATGTEVRGLVVGPEEAISGNSHGAVGAFASVSDNLVKRAYCARKAALAELRTGRIDLLVSHFALYAAPLGGWLKRFPLVVHFHGPWAAESEVEGDASLTLRVKQAVERSVYRRARRLIVLSRSFQEELASRYGVDEQRIRVVPGGVDIARFNVALSRAEARRRLDWPQNRPILLAVRRLVRRMGLENLIDAMAAVSAKCPEALLLLGGTGPIASELQSRIADRGLERHVRLLGRVEDADLPLAYRAADLSVVPSQHLEGFGLITLESLASGTPALVTPVGGLPEIIRPFAPACVFADASTAAIADALIEVLQGSRTVPDVQACRAYAETFAWARIAERVRATYEEALN